MRLRARQDFEISPWTSKILLRSMFSAVPRHMSEIPSSLQIKCSFLISVFQSCFDTRNDDVMLLSIRIYS